MKTYPTEEQITATMEARKLNRMGALQFLRRHTLKSKVEDRKADTAPKEKVAKATKPAISKGDAKHYDQQAVIDGFLKHGKTIAELADAQKMSHVYCHRILTTKVPKEYTAEQERRTEARENAKKALK